MMTSLRRAIEFVGDQVHHYRHMEKHMREEAIKQGRLPDAAAIMQECMQEYENILSCLVLLQGLDK